MKGWGFAFSRRWFGYLALVIVFAIACVGLSEWQVARREETLAAIHKVDVNYDATPLPIAEVLDGPSAFDESQEWTPVVLSGTYITEDQLLVRGRPYGGQPGFEVLTPLLLADGTVFVVDRGWLPTGEAQDSPDVIPDAPAGEVTVVARLKPGEPTLPGRSAPSGQIATIHLPSIQDEVGRTTYTGAYGLMVSENPEPTDARPAAAIKPDRDEGPHLSYAVQWIVFAFFGFFGLGYALRQEFRIRNADDPDEKLRAAERDRRARAKPRSDSDIEDAIVDASQR